MASFEQLIEHRLDAHRFKILRGRSAWNP